VPGTASATTGGLISHTGVGGLTLGGGIAWLMRKHGLAIDNLIGAEVVLADNRVVNASLDENADLFWALRGGGGNFGVVTRFDFRLHPVRSVLAGMVMYPAARAREMLCFFREQTAAAPDELTALFAFLVAPPAPFIPAAMHGAPMCAIVLCW
jgi:FAD/FMN-containing dehydrogenase